MGSIDERIVSVAFDNAKFEQNIATTIGTIAKLNAALSSIGAVNGLDKVDASASKVTLAGPMAAFDKLRAKFNEPVDTKSFDKLEADANKVTLSGPMKSFEKLKGMFSSIEGAAAKVTLAGPMAAFDRLRAKFGGGVGEAAKAFADIEKASAQANLSNVEGGVDRVIAKFSALQTIGVTALATIAHHAAEATGNLIKQVSGFQTVMEGFGDYELKIGATQTIMAGTGEDIQTVTKYLKELDKYADETIYSLSDMTSNIGKFTNAGVDLETAVGAMKGISNVAALSGASTEEAARSMYNLGQAIGQGTVQLRDWRSVEIANMGTKEFKEELIKSAEAMGTLKKGADGMLRSAKGNIVNFKTFNSTLQDGWLTSEALTDALGRYSDKNTELGKRAYAAATDVKTFTMAMTTMAAAAGTGWTDTFDIILGNLPEATEMWTAFTNAIGEVIGKSAEMRNKILHDWKDLGGRTMLIEGISQLWENMLKILGTVREAFRDIFPRKTGEDLFNLTQQFAELMKKLEPSAHTLDTLKRIFAGLFAVLHIGWTVVKETARAILNLLGIVGKGSGGFVEMVASIGDFLVALDDAVSKGGLLKGLFQGITAGLEAPIALLKGLAAALLGLFQGGDAAVAATKALKDLKDGVGPLGELGDLLAKSWDKVARIFGKVAEYLAPVIDRLKEWAERIGDIIATAFAPENFDQTMQAMQTGFLGGILVVLRRFRSSLEITLGDGFLEKIGNSFEVLTGNLKAMQQNLQAKTLLAIAAAIAALAGGVYLLSKIEPKKLATAMTAVAVGLGQMAAVLVVMGKMVTGAGAAGLLAMPVIAVSMIGMATAATILAAAVKIFSTMKWEGIAKGLAGVAGALVAVGAGMKLMGPGLLLQGPALIVLAVGLNIMAAAMKQLAEMSWEELAKGVLGVAFSLTALGAGLAFLGPSLLLTGPGLVAAALGLSMMAGAMSAFGSMDLKTMTKGILGAAAALVAIGIAVMAIPPTVALQGAGLVILAAGLAGLAASIAILGNMKVGTLVKGIVGMGGALVVLGLGLTAMSGTLLGSAALLAAAAALAILGPAIGFMGTLKWSTILSGLAAIAATLTVLAVAGLIVGPPILALSVALGALGLAMGLVTAPIYILAKALELLGASGTKGVAVMVAALTAFVAVLPKIIIDFVKGLVSILGSLAELAPKIVESLGIIIGQILAVVVDAAPKLAEAAVALFAGFLKVLNESAGPFIETGARLIGAFLTGIANNIGKVTEKAVLVVTRFLDALQADAPKITKSGVGTLTAFITGINNHLPALVAKVAEMITKFLTAVTSHIPKIISKGTEMIVKFLGGIASKIGDVIAAGVNLIIKFLEGVGRSVPKIIPKALEVAEKFVRGVARGTAKLVDIGFTAVIDFLNGTARAIRNRGPELRAAGWNVADALIDGIYEGLKELGQKVLNALGDLVKLMPKKVRKLLGIESPSKVFAEIGRYTMAGFGVGIDDGAVGVHGSVESAAKGVIATARDTLNKVPALLEGMMDVDPVIKPVLDLTQVQKEAAKLTELTNVTPITAAASYGQASAISAEQATALAEAAKMPQVAPEIKFEQNNYSPESLSTIEIYRNTNNQVAQLKSLVGLPAA